MANNHIALGLSRLV